MIEEISYSNWVLTAKDLTKPFDYIDFANTMHKDKQTTNRVYANVMKLVLEEAKGKEKLNVANIINTFNDRTVPGSSFYSAYNTYWCERDKQDSEERMAKRQRLSAEAVNEAACSSFEIITSRIADTAAGSKIILSSSARLNTDLNDDSNNDLESDIVCVIDDYELIDDIVYKEFDEKIIFLDKDSTKEAAANNGVTQELCKSTNLPIVKLSSACESLLSKLANCAPSPSVMRSIVRTNTLAPNENFDSILHNDLSFTEVICTHFLNMMESPRNPLQQQQLERNAAYLTTIPILHNLFLSCNDLIDMQWIEKLVDLTENIKWDGVAFVIDNRKIAPLFVELAGGVRFNSGPAKERRDEEKIIKHLINLLKVKKAESSDTNTTTKNNPCQYYLRYHDLKIHFESLTYFGKYYVKRSYFTLPCPSTPSQLKKFIKKIPEVFNYRQGVIAQVQK